MDLYVNKVCTGTHDYLIQVKPLIDFYANHLDIPIKLFSCEPFEKLYSINERPICRKFYIRSNSHKFDCQGSYQELIWKICNKKAYQWQIGKCGLFIGGVPIIIQSKCVVALVTGQIIPSNIDMELFINQARSFGFSLGPYMKALHMTPALTENEFVECVQTLQALTPIIASLISNYDTARHETYTLSKQPIQAESDIVRSSDSKRESADTLNTINPIWALLNTVFLNTIVQSNLKISNLEKSCNHYLGLKEKADRTSRELMKTNSVLSSIANKIDEEKNGILDGISYKMSRQIIPKLNKLRENISHPGHRSEIDGILMLTKEILPDISDKVVLFTTRLSPTELKIAHMIKNGMKSNDIANYLFVSVDTIKTHRKRIRKKLNITDSSINLETFLRSKLNLEE